MIKWIENRNKIKGVEEKENRTLLPKKNKNAWPTVWSIEYFNKTINHIFYF